ncbi:MAG: hypothetical protein ACOX1V_01420 [Candidatus Iainarchaeum sp.]|jgi:hypothetical protein|nr:MAG: hypothetical protein BWY55_00577 [archaeon ADurb.Bin336]
MKKIFCLLTLIFFLSSVYSFECLGVVDSNSLMCKDSNTNLDQNYSISLIDSYLDCNIKKKCEWYCKSGYYLDEGKCLSSSELTCEGSVPQNATMCPNDNINLPRKGITNILVASKNNCSETRKCQWYCNEFHYLGANSKKCLPFVCVGEDFENSLMYYNDDTKLDSNIPKELVDKNTARKCEYYCKDHYQIEVINGVRKCVPKTYFCEGEFENATMFENDNEGLEYNTISVLSKTNTLRKCEWSCNEGYFIYKGECVLKEKAPSCGTANKDYLIEEDFPGKEDLCKNSTPSIKEPMLGEKIGSITRWTCISDINIDCRAIRVGVRESSSDFNSILEVTLNQKDKNTLLISIKCSNEMNLDISAFGELIQKKIELDKNQLDCNSQLTTHEIILKDMDFFEKTITITTSIKETTKNCLNCEKKTQLNLVKSNFFQETNWVLIGGLVLFMIIVIFLMNFIFNSPSEEDYEEDDSKRDGFKEDSYKENGPEEDYEEEDYKEDYFEEFQ